MESSRHLAPHLLQTARHEVGDAAIGTSLVTQCQEIDVGVVATPDRVAGIRR